MRGSVQQSAVMGFNWGGLWPRSSAASVSIMFGKMPLQRRRWSADVDAAACLSSSMSSTSFAGLRLNVWIKVDIQVWKRGRGPARQSVGKDRADRMREMLTLVMIHYKVCLGGEETAYAERHRSGSCPTMQNMSKTRKEGPSTKADVMIDE
ncbi:hypothetical protein BDN70DRAFT_248770 [Pholiota conissans]|uniref:Uncharacterized protein n=1 Tax=Pholiota conissans TaxID=109636 RepID=A0A9P6CQW1_9AGAR|nr:hypothetical protein BDN70DRAFT_248770 [Pholiota conissans]